MTLALRATSVTELAAARAAHLDRLVEVPDLYLELMVPRASAHRIGWDGREAGYCLREPGGCLIEFDLAPWAWSEKERIFAALGAALDCPGALCHSFDSLLLGLCLARGFAAEIVGTLFRDLTDEDGPTAAPGLTLRRARLSDTAVIARVPDAVFDSEQEALESIEKGFLHVLEDGQAVLGFGLLTPIWPDRPERDVGVMVMPESRGRGYASRILRLMKRHCLDQGLRPIAGCASDNLASRRALIRAGFATRYDLLRFTAAGTR